jgi:hypothetical protein
MIALKTTSLPESQYFMERTGGAAGIAESGAKKGLLVANGDGCD